MKKGQKLWTRTEIILAFNLYCKLPFGKMHKGNEDVIRLSQLIKRTPSAVALKLGNLASFDPSLKSRGIKGASNASKLDKKIWDEFYQNWEHTTFESEELLATFSATTIEKIAEIELEGIPKEGKERDSIVKQRVNQSFFRKTVLSSYNFSCCITGISNPELLVAGHINKWSEDVKNRLNPRNGLALNPLHDKAFENGLITITPDYKIKVSTYLKRSKTSLSTEKYFLQYEGLEINLPSKFLPDPNFLRIHNQNRFRK